MSNDISQDQIIKRQDLSNQLLTQIPDNEVIVRRAMDKIYAGLGNEIYGITKKSSIEIVSEYLQGEKAEYENMLDEIAKLTPEPTKKEIAKLKNNKIQSNSIVEQANNLLTNQLSTIKDKTVQDLMNISSNAKNLVDTYSALWRTSEGLEFNGDNKKNIKSDKEIIKEFLELDSMDQARAKKVLEQYHAQNAALKNDPNLLLAKPKSEKFKEQLKDKILSDLKNAKLNSVLTLNQYYENNILPKLLTFGTLESEITKKKDRLIAEMNNSTNPPTRGWGARFSSYIKSIFNKDKRIAKKIVDTMRQNAISTISSQPKIQKKPKSQGRQK